MGMCVGVWGGMSGDVWIKRVGMGRYGGMVVCVGRHECGVGGSIWVMYLCVECVYESTCTHTDTGKYNSRSEGGDGEHTVLFVRLEKNTRAYVISVMGTGK